MKKMLSALLVVVAVTGMLTVNVSAHGHRKATGTTSYPLCTVEDCTTTGSHTHGGTTYCGHYAGDGHDYHGWCAVDGCELTGLHEHDGSYYFCRDSQQAGGHCGRGRNQ